MIETLITELQVAAVRVHFHGSVLYQLGRILRRL